MPEREAIRTILREEKMRSPKSIPAAVLAAVVAVVLTFGAVAARAAEPVKIRISYVVPVANWGPLFVEKADLLHHQGKSYVLETIRFKGTPPMITALATGELEIADLAFSSFALAVENAGMSDLRVIGDEFQDGVGSYYSNEFMVRNDSGIKKVEDLKGKVLATNVAGSGVDIALRAMLRKHHLEDKRDVTIVEAAFPNMGAMLAEKKVDLISGVLPFSLDPKLLKIAHPLFTQKQAVGRTQFILWVAREGFLKKNHAAMVDFMEDILRVERWYLDPKNHKVAVEIAAKVTKRPAASFEGWVFTKKDYYRDPDGKPDLKALQANIDIQKELGFIKSGLDVRKYADLSIVEEAVKRLKK